MTLEELIKKAKELGITVPEDADEDSLNELIEDKVKELEKDDPDDKNDDYWKEEAKSAFNSRDDEKKKRRKLEKQLNDMKKKVEDAPSKGQLDDLEDKLKTLSEFREKVEKEQEDKELKTKTEIERAEIKHNKAVEELTKGFGTEMDKFKTLMGDTEVKMTAKDDQIKSLRKDRLEVEVREAAAKNKAISPKQVALMVKNDFTYNEDLDEFEYVTFDKKGKVEGDMTVDERVKSFLEAEENENLVEADVNKNSLGTDKSKQTTTTKSASAKKSADGKYDPKDKDLLEEAEENGLEVGDYIETLQMRDAKLGKTKQNES